jgi:hypothetical protein
MYSQEHATCPYTEPDAADYVLPSYFHKINYDTVLPNIHVYLRSIVRAGADMFLARPEGNKLQRQNSGFIQHIPYEAH